jgi:GTP-binding protein YchF
MSSLEIGIVGLPNVGKSTLFNALTKSSVLTANYPFATIEPNIGIVTVPDERLNKLADIYKTTKIIPATIRFVDIAGLVAGANKGEGLGNQFLGHIRSTSAILEVVRAFQDSLITHVDLEASPKKDIEVINTELILADLESVNKKLIQLQKETKANPKLAPTLNQLKNIQQILDNGQLIYTNQNSEELELIKHLNLLTAKPIIYVFNVGEENITDAAYLQKLKQLVFPAPAIFIPAKLESELSTIDERDAEELRESYSLHRSGLVNLISLAYDTLGLQSFLTAGEKEVRAWTIKKDSTAPQAAGVIHGDFERGFIAAEIVDYTDLVTLGSLNACKTAGKVRTEGKTYIMQPNDVVEFRFNI